MKTLLHFLRQNRNASPSSTLKTALALLFASTVAAVGGDVVLSENFDSSVGPGLPAGWSVGKHFGKQSPGSSFSIDASPDDGKSLKIVSASQDIPAIALGPLLDVEAGATYRLSADIKGAGEETDIRMFVLPNDFRGASSIATSVSNGWQRLALNFKAATSNIKPVNIRFDLMEPGAIWVDHVVFTKTQAGTGLMSSAEEFRPATVVFDGGFEKAVPGALPAGWKIEKHYGQIPEGASFAVDASVAHTGAHSLKICNPASEAIPALVTSNPVAVEPGEKYVVTAYFKGEAPFGDASLMALRSDFRGADRAPVEVAGSWRRYRKVFEATPQAEAYVARFDVHPGTVWIDDVSITRLSETDPDPVGPALGHRYGESTGAETVLLTVGAPTGLALANINGVCYHRGFGQRNFPSVWTNANLKVVRLHNVLSHLSILRVDPSSQAISCDFSILDEAIKQILAAGAVPQISLCFVPVELVGNPDPRRIRENKYYLGLPDDFATWEEYVRQVVRHCSDTFPRVEDWYWIVGNEPGVRQFSVGTKDDFYRFYQHTLAGAIRANPNICFGAGSFAHFDWLKSFVERCAADNTRLDLLSWHHYDLVPEGYAFRIQRVKDLLSAHPNLGEVKLAIDEWNTILPDFRPAEFSAGNYAAAHAVASIAAMAKAGLDYQTHFIANSPHGWGMMSPKGVKHPTFIAFEMMGRLGSIERALAVPADEPYVGGIAAERTDGSIAVLVWHVKSRNDITPDRDKNIRLHVADCPANPVATRHVIDSVHSNGLADPARAEMEDVAVDLRPRADGGVEIDWTAPPNSVSLIVLAPQKNPMSASPPAIGRSKRSGNRRP
ncbi:MAG: GH39 family glycosyl hydrolase [Kiritimatiellia bacterium]|jgi:hypothetical protein